MLILEKIKYVLLKIGIDKAIFFTSVSSLIGTLGSVISVLLIINLFNEVEQGFYYTFGSILSIQVFFELGFNNIITQFAAHETGKPEYKIYNLESHFNVSFSRLSSLLNLIIRWYSVLFLILFFALLFSGFYFFSQNSSNVSGFSWEFPWILVVISSCFSFLISPILAYLIGIGDIKVISKLQLNLNIIKISLLLFGLVLGFKLYSIGLSLTGAVLYIYIQIFKKYKDKLFQIWKIKRDHEISYFKEIFPYQWRIALSWISGYFIFHLFNPVLFVTEGPKVAGQMGMTLTALSGISTLSLSWITTKVPQFSNLIASNEFVQLKVIFNKVFKQSFIINFLLLFLFLFFIFLLKYFKVEFNNVIIGDRFIDYIPLLLMSLSTLLNQITSSWALYLRCFKKEPYLFNSIVGAILVCVSTFYFGNKFGLMGITLGYFSISLIGLPWAYFIFLKNKVL